MKVDPKQYRYLQYAVPWPPSTNTGVPGSLDLILQPVFTNRVCCVQVPDPPAVQPQQKPGPGHQGGDWGHDWRDQGRYNQHPATNYFIVYKRIYITVPGYGICEVWDARIIMKILNDEKGQ